MIEFAQTLFMDFLLLFVGIWIGQNKGKDEELEWLQKRLDEIEGKE